MQVLGVHPASNETEDVAVFELPQCDALCFGLREWIAECSGEEMGVGAREFLVGGIVFLPFTFTDGDGDGGESISAKGLFQLGSGRKLNMRKGFAEG